MVKLNKNYYAKLVPPMRKRGVSLRAEGELHKLALSEAELKGTRPLFSSPTIEDIRNYAKQQAEQPLPTAATAVMVEDLYSVGEQVSAANLVWGELYSQIGWD